VVSTLNVVVGGVDEAKKSKQELGKKEEMLTRQNHSSN